MATSFRNRKHLTFRTRDLSFAEYIVKVINWLGPPEGCISFLCSRKNWREGYMGHMSSKILPWFSKSAQRIESLETDQLCELIHSPDSFEIKRSTSYFIPSCLLSAKQYFPLIPLTHSSCQTLTAFLVIPPNTLRRAYPPDKTSSSVAPGPTAALKNATYFTSHTQRLIANVVTSAKIVIAAFPNLTE